MSQNEQQPQMAYPYPTPAGAYAAPPPSGYPVRNKDDLPKSHHVAPVETKSRGDGFWKGCYASLCCCCVQDADSVMDPELNRRGGGF